MAHGYFEIGIYHCKRSVNIGTLWRSAYQLGAAGIFVIGHRFKNQCSDTAQAYRHIPLREYHDMAHLKSCLPYGASVVGIEMGGRPLTGYTHPMRAVYVLGAEDSGLPARVMEQCHSIVSLESVVMASYNVAVAGTLVMYHRVFGSGCHHAQPSLP